MTPDNSNRFPELTVSGSPSEMGRNIGENFSDQIVELSELVLERFNKGSEKTISWAQAEDVARRSFERVGDYFPGPLEELHGTTQAAGVPVERLMVLNAIVNMLAETSEGCTSIMVSSESSKSGVGFAGQNWDNDPAMAPLSAVITRKGAGKAAFTSWQQPGVVAYMGFNSSGIGIGICMNALNGPTESNGLPWYFFVRSILESNSTAEAIQAVESAPRALTANAAMITAEGPLNLEITPGSVESITADGQGVLVHTNQCAHPALNSYNDEFEDRIYGQSFDRRSRAQGILSNQDKVSIDDAKKLLSDHDGFPTSICRHPNDDPKTGWQRSVISIILEPEENRMHVSNGNLCENRYETYNAG